MPPTSSAHLVRSKEQPCHPVVPRREHIPAPRATDAMGTVLAGGKLMRHSIKRRAQQFLWAFLVAGAIPGHPQRMSQQLDDDLLDAAK